MGYSKSMFIAKRLMKMAPPGLTFVEHCANLVMDEFSQNMFDFLTFFQIDTVFMRNAD